MTPDDPRYYDPRFDVSGEPVRFLPLEKCPQCGDMADEFRQIDDERMCLACYEELPWCGDGDHRFTAEPWYLEGFEEVFCSEECRNIAQENWT